jgi:hypothetical protein
MVETGIILEDVVRRLGDGVRRLEADVRRIKLSKEG